ncbi:ABC transporter ATP-binding protein [bacterium]|nr:ABC transporter ATP-binding protein [bacterium]
METSPEVGGLEKKPWVLRTFRYFRPHARDLVLAALLLGASTALTLAGPLILKHAIDVEATGPARSLAGLARWAWLYVGQLALLVVVTWCQRVILNRIGQSSMAALRAELLSRVVSLPVSTFDEQPSGKLIARVMDDVETLRNLMTSAFLALLGDFVLFAAMAVTMLVIDWKLALVGLAVLPPIAFGFHLFRKHAGPRFAEARARNADLVGFLAEHLRCMPVLQAFDRAAWARERCRELSGARFEAETASERIVIPFFNGIMMMEALGQAAILLVGGAGVAAGTRQIGTLVAFLDYMRRYYEPLHRLSEQLGQLERARVSALRVYALMDREPEPELLLPATPIVPGSEGELRFEDVWFSYRKEPAGEDDWALRGVTFTVPRAAKFALVGPTGHGKSTILSLLLRFHVAQKGRVLVGGRDVRSIPLRELRGQFGLVLQDVRLFPGTLEDNVLLGAGGGEDAARAALGALDALDLVSRLPDGLATVLGDGGEGLSFGERQLIAAARALAREPGILLLDEATSSVDPATEARLHRALERLSRGRTSLTVAHRLATVRAADRILFVERGRITESGTRDELRARNGRYAALERLQALDAAPRGEPALAVQVEEAVTHGLG